MRRKISGASIIILAFVAACTARSDEINPATAGGDGGPVAPPASPPPPPPPPPPSSPPSAQTASFPNSDDGLPIMQLGLGPVRYYSLEDPFLNLLEDDGYDWAARGAAAAADMSFDALYQGGFIDKTTMAPTAIPAGYSFISTGLFRFGARYYPNYFAGTYVFDWEGDGDARCGFGFSGATRKINANRIECDYPATSNAWGRIELTRVTASFKNPRLYRKENEAAINAGEIFTPNFTGLVSGYKVFRTMDVQDANASWIRKAAELPTSAMVGWGSGTAREANIPNLPRGAPLDILARLAVRTKTALWLDVPPIMGAPDGIEDAQYQSDSAAIRAFAAANADAIIASPEWRRYADAVVASLKAEAYPASTMLYQEVGNEIWNFGNPYWRMTYYYWGLGDALEAKTGGSGEGFRYALGWLTANYAVQFDAALKAAGRDNQAWTIVLAGQNAFLARTTVGLQGAKDYFTAAGLDPAVWMKKIGVSTATYYNGIFDLKTGLFPAADEAARDLAWLSAIAADPAGLMTSVADWVISSGASSQALPSIVSLRAQQKAEAAKFGAAYIGDYEGDSSLVVPASLRANQVFLAWLRTYLMSDEAMRVDKARIDALFAQDRNAIIANYESIGPFVIDQAGDFDPAKHPWIDGFWTDNTGRDRALAPFLRPPG